MADRSLMPGDVVRRFVRGRDTQRGYCRRVTVFCAVQVMGTGQVLHDVRSDDLRPVEDFVTDVVVCRGAWLGMIKTVRSQVTVQFADGSVCVLDDKEAEELEDVLNTRDEESEFRRYDFYPGQVLSGPLKIFTGGNFTTKTPEMERTLKTEKKNKPYRVVVLQCKAHTLGVNWQCKTNNNGNRGGDTGSADNAGSAEVDDPSGYAPPAYTVTDENLSEKVHTLNVFESCTIQIGDRNFYTVKDKDASVTKEQWKRMEREALKIPPKAKKGAGAASASVSAEGSRRLGKRKRTEEASGAAVAASAAAAAPAKSDVDRKKDDSDESYEDMDDSESNSVSTESEEEDEEKSEKKAQQHHSKRPAVPVGRTGGGGGGLGGAGGRKKLKKARRGGGFSSAPSSAPGAASASSTSASAAATNSGKTEASSSVMLELKPGERIAVEVLRTRSEADVIWQDGTVERGIPSTELFPIHHLDDQEFFCGDFVVRSDSEADPHSYGVVQAADHLGRTCRVKWFRTYTTGSAEAR